LTLKNRNVPKDCRQNNKQSIDIKKGIRGAKLEYFNITATDEDIKREKEKARQLRKTGWWKSKISSGVCYYCKAIFPPNKLTMDHIIPLSAGGKSVKSNLIAACKNCNTAKGGKLPF
jgi:5-methylcytosine-specific restriction endonuclease McrA